MKLSVENGNQARKLKVLQPVLLLLDFYEEKRVMHQDCTSLFPGHEIRTLG